jgi:cation transport ATPase
MDVGPGSVAVAGAVNGGGLLDVEVTAPPPDSTLSRIVRHPARARPCLTPPRRYINLV